MISYLVKGLDNSPMIGTAVLLAFVFALGIAPQFTSDPFLKLLPMFLIPLVMITSSDTTGFSINPDIMLMAGIVTAVYIKLLTLLKDTEDALKNPKQRKIMSAMVYISIYIVYMMSLVGINNFTSFELHGTTQTSAMYPILFIIYVGIAIFSVTGLTLGKSSSKSPSSTPPAYRQRSPPSPPTDS